MFQWNSTKNIYSHNGNSRTLPLIRLSLVINYSSQTKSNDCGLIAWTQRKFQKVSLIDNFTESCNSLRTKVSETIIKKYIILDYDIYKQI